MANTEDAIDLPTSFDADTLYEVQFARTVQAGSFRYLPRDTVRFRGAALTAIVAKEGLDAIRTAVAR